VDILIITGTIRYNYDSLSGEKILATSKKQWKGMYSVYMVTNAIDLAHEREGTGRDSSRKTTVPRVKPPLSHQSTPRKKPSHRLQTPIDLVQERRKTAAPRVSP